ncbi:MAG: glutathione S-transferase [Hyphomicrobiaceae bacterium]|jgi:glutathione S-transferase
MRKLHGVALSPYVRKVRIALEEKGLEYENEPVLPMNFSDDFLKLSPLGKIPVYEEDGWTVPDSSIICDYLDRTVPQPALYPTDPRERAEAAFLEEWSDTALVSQGVGPVFFNRVVKPTFLKEEADQAAIDQALNEDLPKLQDYLESRLADGRTFFVSNAFTIADIAIAAAYVSLAHTGEAPDSTKWPKLAAWLQAMHSRPTFAKVIAEERAMLGLTD